jgi:hypothetical protein
MPAGAYEFLYEDDLWDNFLELWKRLDEQERPRVTQAYRGFCSRFGPNLPDTDVDDHPSLPGIKVLTREPLKFHFAVDRDNRAVFLLNMFYVNLKLEH